MNTIRLESNFSHQLYNLLWQQTLVILVCLINQFWKSQIKRQLFIAFERVHAMTCFSCLNGSLITRNVFMMVVNTEEF